MSPDRTAQSLHPVASPGHLSRKSRPDQPKDHRPAALPGAARESRARAISRLGLFFVRLLREGHAEAGPREGPRTRAAFRAVIAAASKSAASDTGLLAAAGKSNSRGRALPRLVGFSPRLLLFLGEQFVGMDLDRLGLGLGLFNQAKLGISELFLLQCALLGR